MSDAAKTIEALKSGMDTITKKLDDIETKRKDDDASIGAIFRSGAGHTIVGGNSDEKKCLQYFGCSSPLQLLQVNTAAPKFKHVPEELKHLVRELKNAADCARWTSQMFHDQPKDKIGTTAELDRASHVKGMLDHNYGRNEFAPRLKAFGSTVAGGGDEWVPTIISSQYVEEYQLLRAVEDKFTEMPMASNPYQLPTQSGVTKARLIAENTGMTSTNFNTGVITFNAKKLAEYYVMPEELNEDSAVAIYALAKFEVMEAQRRAVEAAILNGDSDGTHLDSDTQAAGADVAEKAWNGLRRQAIANTANGGTTNFSGAVSSEALLGSMRSKMKKFGVNPRELVWFLDPIGYQQFLQLTSVATLEKYGQSATVITGELARYQGIPIIVSEYMRSDLNATGVYDGITSNKTAALLVNMRRWWIGMRRPIRLKVMEDLANQDRWLLASYQRKDFQGYAQSASEVSVSYGYNILV